MNAVKDIHSNLLDVVSVDSISLFIAGKLLSVWKSIYSVIN